jgi:hypothetical protein
MIFTPQVSKYSIVGSVALSLDVSKTLGGVSLDMGTLKSTRTNAVAAISRRDDWGMSVIQALTDMFGCVMAML